MLSAVSHEFTATIAQAFGGEAYHAAYLRDAAEMYKHGILMMGREASQHCTFIHFIHGAKTNNGAEPIQAETVFGSGIP